MTPLPITLLRLSGLAAVLIALSVAQQAHGMAADEPQRLHIERSTLEHVLMEITRLSGQPVSFASSLVKDRWAGPIDGTMTAADAARVALQNSGLALSVLPDGTLTVVEAGNAGTPDAQPRDIGALPPSEVHGVGDTGFAVLSSSAITRVEMPMTSMTHAVNTVTRGLLASQQPTSLNAALAQAGVASVLADPTAPPLYAIRGYLTNTISVDGLPDKLASLRPVDALEEIDVIKGPNADVASVAMAGGAINASLKAPTVAAQRSVAMEISSHTGRKAVADLAGAIGANGLAYRMVALKDTTADSDAGYAGHRVSYVHAALGWHDSATSITAGIESLTSRQPVPPATFALGGAPARVPMQLPFGNVDDRVEGSGTRVYYTASRNLSDDWAIHSRASYESVREESAQWDLGSASSYNATPNNTICGLRQTESHLWALSNELTGTLSHNAVRHTFTLGWEEIQERQNLTKPGFIAQVTQDPFAPVPLPEATFVPGNRLSQTLRQSIFRLRDHISIGDRWEVSGSIRANNYVALLPHMELRGVAWTPAVGVLYKLTPTTAWFADYMRGFQINTGYFYDGTGTQPERSRQVETGLRWENAHHTLTAQAALYRIDAKNVSLADVSHPGYYTQLAEQTNQGVELSVQGTVARGWEASLWLSASRMSARLPGGYVPGVPARNAALWTTYTIQSGVPAGAGVGLGISAQGRADAHGDVSFRVPGAVRVDSSLFWHRKRWRIDLFARNVFNVRTYGNTLSSSYIPILPGRTLALRVTHNF